MVYNELLTSYTEEISELTSAKLEKLSTVELFAYSNAMLISTVSLIASLNKHYGKDVENAEKTLESVGEEIYTLLSDRNKREDKESVIIQIEACLRVLSGMYSTLLDNGSKHTFTKEGEHNAGHGSSN